MFPNIHHTRTACTTMEMWPVRTSVKVGWYSPESSWVTTAATQGKASATSVAEAPGVLRSLLCHRNLATTAWPAGLLVPTRCSSERGLMDFQSTLAVAIPPIATLTWTRQERLNDSISVFRNKKHLKFHLWIS